MITSGTGVSHGDICVVGGAGPGVSHDYVPCMVGVSHGVMLWDRSRAMT